MRPVDESGRSLELKKLVQLSREGALPSGLDEVLGPISGWLKTDRLEGFVSRRNASSTSALSGGQPFSHLSICARRFHLKAGTFTPEVEMQLRRLESGQAVRLSHQPNFGAYCKLLFLFPALDVLARAMNAAGVYLFNDLDLAWNDRFRRATLPAVDRPLGYEYLRLPVSQQSKSLAGFTVAAPKNGWLADTAAHLVRAFTVESRLLGNSDADLGQLHLVIDDLKYAVSVAESLTDMTAILLSRHVVLRLNMPIIFVPAHDMWQAHGLRESLHLLSRWQIVQVAQREVAREYKALGFDKFEWHWLEDADMAPYWWICSCGRRTALRFRGMDFMRFIGRCHECGSVADFDIVGALADVGYQQLALRLLPRIGMQNLAISAYYGFGAGITYLSSAPHTLVYGTVGERIGIGLLPQVFLDPKGTFGTPIERAHRNFRLMSKAPGLAVATDIVAAGRASCLYVSTRVPFAQLARAGVQWIENDGFDSPISVSLV